MVEDKKLYNNIVRVSKIMQKVEFGCRIPGYFTGLGGNVTIKRTTKTMLVLRLQFSSCDGAWYKQHSIPLHYLKASDSEVRDTHIKYVLSVIQDRRDKAVEQALHYYLVQVNSVNKFKKTKDEKN